MVRIPVIPGQRRGAEFLQYANVASSVGNVITAKLATLHELQTIYSFRDMYDLLEIAAVNASNQRLVNRKA